MYSKVLILSLPCFSCTQMKVLATVLSLSRSQQQTGTSSAVPAVGSKVPAVLVKRPAEEESSSTSQQQTATGSVVPTVSSEASSMAVKRPAEASPCPEPPKRRSQRIAKKK